MSPVAKLQFDVPEVQVVWQATADTKWFFGALAAVLVVAAIAVGGLVVQRQNAVYVELEERFRNRAYDLQTGFELKVQRIDERHSVNVRHLEARVYDLQTLVETAAKASACRCPKPAPTPAK